MGLNGRYCCNWFIFLYPSFSCIGGFTLTGLNQVVPHLILLIPSMTIAENHALLVTLHADPLPIVIAIVAGPHREDAVDARGLLIGGAVRAQAAFGNVGPDAIHIVHGAQIGTGHERGTAALDPAHAHVIITQRVATIATMPCHSAFRHEFLTFLETFGLLLIGPHVVA